jgi:hypothetical protein
MNPNREEALFGLALEEPAAADRSPLRGLAYRFEDDRDA